MKYKCLLVAGLILALSITPANAGILSGIKNLGSKLGGFIVTEAKNLPDEILQGIVSVKVVPTVAGLVTLKMVKSHPRNIYVTVTGTSGKVVSYIITLLKPIPMAILEAVLVLKLLPFFLWLL